MKNVTIEFWQVEKLIPYGKAIRKNDQLVSRMVALIEEFGFKLPLLIRGTGQIVDGHLRLKAAQKLKIAEVPVIRCDEWTDAQVKAFRLAVNRSATWAAWDWTVVGQELAELKDLNFNLAFTGFEGNEIDRLLLQFRGEGAEDAMASREAEPVSAAGDVWLCDRHRVVCSDATTAKDVAQLLHGLHPTLMVTDPPYGVDYDPMWREQAGLGKQRQTGVVTNDDRVDWSEAYALFPGDVAYVWHAGIHAPEVASSLRTASFEIRSQIIWAKQHFAMSRGHYHWQHEPCWYAVRKGRSGNWRGDRKESTLWEVSNLNPFGADQKEDSITGHGTQKPVELMRRPILNHTEEGELVYDPFLGSGSTLVAAEQVNRICYGIEISPCYVDVIVARWQNLTGKEAVLEGESRTFEQVRAERQPSVATAEGKIGNATAQF
jgi:DNA modification methylase